MFSVKVGEGHLPVTFSVHPHAIVSLVIGVNQGTLTVHLTILDLSCVLHFYGLCVGV